MYTFPLPHNHFMDALPIERMTCDLPAAVEMSETGGGELLTSALGTRLWQGEVTLGKMTQDEAAWALAQIDAARQIGASFMIYDVSRAAPRSDLTGATLGSASPTLSAVASHRREIRLTGLPAGYQLWRYDYIAFSYGTDPTRFALHRSVDATTASAGGLTGWLEVVPPIRPGFTLGAPVILKRASCKAVIVPGSVQPGRRTHTMTEGASFRWQQTLR